MDHPLIGNERRGTRAGFAAARRSAYVPPLNLETSRASSERVERHLAAVAPSATAVALRPAPTRHDADQAAALLREIAPRAGAQGAATRGRRFSLRAPLRSVKRWFGF